MGNSLRIGFVISPGYEVPAWYNRTINEVLEKGHSVFFIQIEDNKPRNKLPPFLYRLFSRFERKWFKPQFDATATVSIAHLTNAENIVFYSNKNLPANERILNFGPDLVYTIEPDIEQLEELSTLATYGLWSIHFGFGQYTNRNLPAFWEVMDNSPVTGSYLLVRKDGNICVAYEGTTRSVPYSVKNNFNSIAWKSSSYLAYRLSQLDKQRYDFLLARPIPDLSIENGSVHWPGNFQMLVLFCRNITRYLGYKIKQQFSKRRFAIHYSFKQFSLESITATTFQPIDLPRHDYFYADPFVIKRQDTYYIFFEEYMFSRGKAHISLIEIDKSGKPNASRIIMEKPYHLSYPFIFELHGDYYMIPDCSENKTVSLYRATKFPDNWEFVMDLFEGKQLIDTTVLFKDGLWWLFANSSNHPTASTNDQLFLYYSENLFSTDWKPHPTNPIATHAGNCRPAGRVFMKDGKIYRPAQNNASRQYGSGLRFNEIEVLTVDDYREREVLSIYPKQFGLKAMHHIDFTGDLIVIDGIS